MYHFQTMPITTVYSSIGLREENKKNEKTAKRNHDKETQASITRTRQISILTNKATLSLLHIAYCLLKKTQLLWIALALCSEKWAVIGYIVIWNYTGFKAVAMGAVCAQASIRKWTSSARELFCGSVVSFVELTTSSPLDVHRSFLRSYYEPCPICIQSIGTCQLRCKPMPFL